MKFAHLITNEDADRTLCDRSAAMREHDGEPVVTIAEVAVMVAAREVEVCAECEAVFDSTHQENIDG